MNKVFSTILSHNVKEEDVGKSVEYILKNKLNISSGLLTELKLSGKIKINNTVCRSVDIVKLDDIVSADIYENKTSNIPPYDFELEILFEDAHILVVNKPPGLSVHPSLGNYEKTLAGAIIAHWIKNDEMHSYHSVNRLDKDTSGICIITKNRYSHARLSEKGNIISKEYSAIVHGKIDSADIINLNIKRANDSIIKRVVAPDGKEAITIYAPVRYTDKYSLLKIKLLTGRTHQIRVHFSHIGHPLYGDWLYGYGDIEKKLISRHALVSDRVGFYHPVSGEYLEFKVDLPEDMLELLEKL